LIAPRYVVPESIYHAQAATALGEIGPVAKEAIPALTAATEDKNVIFALRAKAALIKIRQESVEPLLVLLQTQPPQIGGVLLAWQVSRHEC